MILLAAEQTAVGPALPDVLATLAFYVGAFVLIGVATTGLFAFERAPVAALRLLGPAWAIATAGALARAQQARADVPIELGRFLSLPIGRAALIRLAALVLVHEGVMLAVLGRDRGRRIGLAIAGIGSAVAIGGHLQASHAAALRSPLPALVQQWVHVVAAGVWIGGLAALLAGIRSMGAEDRAAATRRFSRIAGVSLGIVVLTGSLRAFTELGGVDALVGSSYGKLVLTKWHLLVVIALGGAINRYRNVPAIDGAGARGLRRVGSAELAAALAVLAFTAVLSGVQPGRESAVAAPSSFTYPEEVRLAGRVTLQAFADPARAGRNEVHLTFFDRRGDEIRARAVRLTAFKGDVRLEPDLRRFTPGHFIADADLEAGTWRFRMRAVVADRRVSGEFLLDIGEA